MPSYDPVIKNGVNGAIILIGLMDANNPGSLKAAPTLATGDFKIEIDGGAAANLTTLPTVSPAGGTSVKITLSQSEVNGDNLVINCIDQTNPKEWTDTKVIVQTAGDTVNLGFTVPAIGRGTVTSGATPTSIPTSSFTPAGASLDQFAGRVVLFDVNTTTPGLRGCARAITSSSVAAAPTFTVVSLPGTPVSGDTFSVI